ncbi:MAG: DUF4384 domain-containing protein [Bacteroidales bacterium]|nr:DUF4384 domain-containing protein [Bacteroidales bacterium]
MKLHLLLAATALLALSASASDVKNVSGESIYYGERSQGPDECKRLALQQARVNALAKEFGTMVSHTVLTADTQDTDNALLLNETEVKGEWIIDTAEPEYKLSLADDGTIVVACKVKGQARALSNSATEFVAKVLRNGTDDRDAATSFRSGDQMYVRFRAPMDGYVAIFLNDPAGTFYTLLPYATSPNGEVKVKGSKEYTFFSRSEANAAFGEPDELILSTDDDLGEWNRLYILFSPRPFSRPADVKTDALIPPKPGIRGVLPMAHARSPLR